MNPAEEPFAMLSGKRKNRTRNKNSKAAEPDGREPPSYLMLAPRKPPPSPGLEWKAPWLISRAAPGEGFRWHRCVAVSRWFLGRGTGGLWGFPGKPELEASRLGEVPDLNLDDGLLK